MASNNNTTKFLVWIIISVAIAGVLVWITSMFFPQIIAKFTSLLIGLFVVITGLFLRRRK